MKTLITVLGVILMTGCGGFSRMITSITGEFTYRCSKSGVEYIQSDSGIALHVHKNGTPVSCKF